VSTPGAWVGRSLRDIDCRARYGVAVLAVRPSGRIESGYELPDPDRPLGAGDSLVLAGTAEALRVAQALWRATRSPPRACGFANRVAGPGLAARGAGAAAVSPSSVLCRPFPREDRRSPC